MRRLAARSTGRRCNRGCLGTFVTGTGTWDVSGNHIPDGTGQAVTRTGFVCIIGLPHDTSWTVTEVTPPSGYQAAAPASQVAEVDDDGDCNSPDAVFQTATPEQSQQPSATPTPRARSRLGPATAPTGTTEGGVKAGQGTPGASQPDTSVGTGAGGIPVPTLLFLAVLVLSLAGLAYANVDTARRRR